MSSAVELRGSCLCKDMQYALTRIVGPVLHCHCSMCRKATGAAFRTRVNVPSDALRWVEGEHLLVAWRQSVPTS
jgi:hypothetical protein